MKKIPLSQGKVALVDDEDFERINQWKWYARKDGHTYYALRNNGDKTFLMHREILGAVPSGRPEVDHQDHNGLNNQKTNIRWCTRSDNAMNRLHYMQARKKSTGATSKYKGVNLHPVTHKWVARIRVAKDSCIHLGYYTNEIDAAKAYDKEATIRFGQLARVNFPSGGISNVQDSE